MKTIRSVLRIVSCLILFALLGSACDKKPAANGADNTKGYRKVIHSSGEPVGLASGIIGLHPLQLVEHPNFKATIDAAQVAFVHSFNRANGKFTDFVECNIYYLRDDGERILTGYPTISISDTNRSPMKEFIAYACTLKGGDKVTLPKDFLDFQKSMTTNP
jgi:hypothetical protein